MRGVYKKIAYKLKLNNVAHKRNETIKKANGYDFKIDYSNTAMSILSKEIRGVDKNISKCELDYLKRAMEKMIEMPRELEMDENILFSNDDMDTYYELKYWINIYLKSAIEGRYDRRSVAIDVIKSYIS